MSIKKMNAQILSVSDTGLIRAVDEVGAVFVFEPTGEDQPRAMCWSRGDRVRFSKISLAAAYPWRGTRESSAAESRHDRAFFRVVPTVEE